VLCRLGCKGDQPLDELAMMLSLVGSNFLALEGPVGGGERRRELDLFMDEVRERDGENVRKGSLL
jgi:hypothetical protein